MEFIQNVCNIGQQDFERLLLKTAIAELKNRISVIRSSGIFNDWSYPDQIRLARMLVSFEREKGFT